MKQLAHPDINGIESPGLFHALGDSARLQIVKNLFNSKQPLTCSEAVEGIENLPVSTRSHCFRVLRESGLIRSEKQGRECYNQLRLDELNNKFPGLIKAIVTKS